jgi:sugar lactone lactonase YvrE
VYLITLASVSAGAAGYSVTPTNWVEGPVRGTDCVWLAVSPATTAWTNTSGATWLHLGATNGTGSTNVAFTFDANTNATRTGLLSIAGQAVTVTQAGTNYVPAGAVTIVASAPGWTDQIAVDKSNNVYAAYGSGILKWTAANNTSSNLFPSGASYYTYYAQTVAVDASSNLYFISVENGKLSEWNPNSQITTTLASSGFDNSESVALDAAGNLYIADTGSSTIKKWSVTNSSLTTMISTNLDGPGGVAVDVSGNIYIADSENSAVKMWNPATGNLTTLAGPSVIPAYSGPYELTVDGAGNVFFTINNALMEWNAANGAVTTVSTNESWGVAVDAAENLYISTFAGASVMELPRAFVNSTAVTESALAGNDSLPAVVPATQNLQTPFAPATNQAWLRITGVTNGVVSFSFTTNSGSASRTAEISLLGQSISIVQAAPVFVVSPTNFNVGPAAGSNSVALSVNVATAAWTNTATASWLHLVSTSGAGSTNVGFSFDTNIGAARTGSLTIAGQTVLVTQAAPTFVMGLTNRVEGPGSGSNSVMLTVNVPTALWTNQANATWLHVVNTTGSGPTNILFSFDVNPGATRTGTLTVAGQTLTIVQAGATYQPANSLATLASKVPESAGVTLDAAGNVYFSAGISQVQEWLAASNTLTTLISTGLKNPQCLELDATGNVYFADFYNQEIKRWNVASDTVTILDSTQSLFNPTGIALDGAGNVYYANTGSSQIREWIATSNLDVVVFSSGLANPQGLARDIAGNFYIADSRNSAVKEWNPVSGTVTTLVSSNATTPLYYPYGVAVDGSGNVFIGDTDDNAIKQWNFVSNSVVTLLASNATTALFYPEGIAVDAWGNVYLADQRDSAIKELTRAFVDSTPRSEPAVGGNDALPAVLPTAENLAGPFWPTSDQSWLTITGVTNGIVSFSVAANPAGVRTANISLLGKVISITQAAPAFVLACTNLVEGPAAACDGVLLAVDLPSALWTNVVNVGWLHPFMPNGVGPTNDFFSFDANPGATRAGTLAVGGQTVTITQAGTNYVAVGTPTTLVSSGLNSPYALTVDGAGNVYIVDTDNAEAKRWNVASNTVSTVIVSGLARPYGIALDSSNNLYITDPGYFNGNGYSAVLKWTASSGALSMLFGSGLSYPWGVAVDRVNNVYAADGNNGTVQKWTAANHTLSTVMSGLSSPYGLAVDALGDLYTANYGNNTCAEWIAAMNTTTNLPVSGLYSPAGVAVDGRGNVYIANSYPVNSVTEWSPANQCETTVVGSGLYNPLGVAADGAGDLYIADTQNNAIKELPRAFVFPTLRTEPPSAGSDTLPAVVPATANLTGPFAPVSSQPWLAITGVTNGMVSFSYPTNTGAPRTANLTLLGQAIAITQSALGAATRPVIVGPGWGGTGAFQFGFTNGTAGACYTVLSSTNLLLPLANWTVLGVSTNTPTGLFDFTDTNHAGGPRFYQIRSP